MPAAPPRPFVAIFNGSEDVMALLQHVLQEEGFDTAVGNAEAVRHGRQDILAFLAEHDPQVVVWDVSPPYEATWQFLQQVLTLADVCGRRFVLTTTNKRLLDEVAGPTPAIELAGMPADLNAIVRAVRHALAAPALGVLPATHYLQFDCGHQEPATWYPELTMMPATPPHYADLSTAQITVMPADVRCAWCNGEDQTRLAAQARTLAAATPTSFYLRLRQSPIETPEQRQHWTPAGEAYRERMARRGREQRV